MHFAVRLVFSAWFQWSAFENLVFFCALVVVLRCPLFFWLLRLYGYRSRNRIQQVANAQTVLSADGIHLAQAQAAKVFRSKLHRVPFNLVYGEKYWFRAPHQQLRQIIVGTGKFGAY